MLNFVQYVVKMFHCRTIVIRSELSTGRMDPRVESGRVGSEWSVDNSTLDI